MEKKAEPLIRKKPVTVVGAGFSGLVSAFYLSRAGFQVEVIESTEKVGGLIQTLSTSFGLVETAANGFLNSKHVENLFGFMGLEITATLKEAKRRYIFRAGHPRRWPVGLIGTTRLAWFILRFLFRRKSVAPHEGESVREWATRVMGREVSQYLVEAALQGIYAGDPSRMSAKLIFQRFFIRRKSPLEKPKIRGTVTAPEGMGQLMQRMRTRLEHYGVTFRLQTKFEVLKDVPNHPIIIATSAPAAAEILVQIDTLRANALKEVELLPVISLTASFKDAPKAATGFGCLFPPAEPRRALGVLMNNFIFPNRAIKGYSETWILGGAKIGAESLLESSDQDLLNLVIEERHAVLNAGGDTFGFRVTRWPKALPHYTLQLEKALPEMQGLRQNVVLIGNYLGQIGISKILERALVLPEEIHTKGHWKSELK